MKVNCPQCHRELPIGNTPDGLDLSQPIKFAMGMCEGCGDVVIIGADIETHSATVRELIIAVSETGSDVPESIKIISNIMAASTMATLASL